MTPNVGVQRPPKAVRWKNGLGPSAYDLAARETAKLSSSIWKRVIAPLETVRTNAKADSMIFPVALILVLSSPTMTALSSPAKMS